AREKLRPLVAAVVHQRLVQAPEARAGIRREVLEVERLDHVEHEVRARTLDDDVAGMAFFGPRRVRGSGGGGARPPRHRHAGSGRGRLQEFAALERTAGRVVGRFGSAGGALFRQNWCQIPTPYATVSAPGATAAVLTVGPGEYCALSLLFIR